MKEGKASIHIFTEEQSKLKSGVQVSSAAGEQTLRGRLL